MKEIKIGSSIIGFNHKPYFVADIAANHDGDINRAIKLIELAKESGADAAKFQNFKANKIVSDIGFKEMHGQLSHQKNWKKSVFETYKDASLPDDWTPILKKKCDEVGIEYMTSPYDFGSVDVANQYSNCFKIGSGDISWHEIIDYIAKKNKPVMIATGAATLKEVKMAMDILLNNHNDIVLMQCNTNYTAEDENFKYINLNVLKTYSELYPDVVLGLSDHTIGYATVLGAIALGARVIEKHFTDDNTRIGPDHKFSTTPSQWKDMVKASNQLFLALGDGVKVVEGNEKDTSIVQKRGLYITKDMRKGDLIYRNDVEPLRPRNDDGFEPYEIDDVIGKTLACDICKGQLLLKKDIL